MTIIYAVRTGSVTAHAALLTLVAPERCIVSPHIVAIVMFPHDLVADAIFKSLTSLQSLDPVATLGFPQLLQNALLPAPRDLPGVRSPGAAALPVD